MSARPILAALIAAVAVAGTASAASLTGTSEVTLANIQVGVPACDESASPSGVPITWVPERPCGDELVVPAPQPSGPAEALVETTPAEELSDSEQTATADDEPAVAEPIEPAQPSEPVEPVEPVEPSEPSPDPLPQPDDPAAPVVPEQPSEPADA